MRVFATMTFSPNPDPFKMRNNMFWCSMFFNGTFQSIINPSGIRSFKWSHRDRFWQVVSSFFFELFLRSWL